MNPNEIATRQDIYLLQQKVDKLTNLIEKLQSNPDSGIQEVYLTSKEVTDTFKISKSHLCDLRIEGKIPYSDSFGVLLYPKSEIENILKNGGGKR
jgi:hypothetical protein